MKRLIFCALLFLTASTVFAQCPGACPIRYGRTYRAQTRQYSQTYATRYAQTYAAPRQYAQTYAAPCEAVQRIQPCEPVATCEPIETIEPCAPVATCAPVETIQPCAPVERDETIVKTETVPCINGVCPIRKTAQTAARATANVVASLLSRANIVRARYGLPALQYDQTLEVGAESQAAYCAKLGTLQHGYGAAEILAMNQTGFDGALDQWLASPSHRALLLGNYAKAGAAIHVDQSGRVWCAMRFR